MGLAQRVREYLDDKPASAAERRLIRKLDLTILPFLCLIAFVNYLDRANLSNAYVSGMQEDVGFKGTDYNNAVSLFTAGYCIGGFPNSIIVGSNRIRMSYWFPFCALSWGLLTLGLAFVHHVWQVQVIRFFCAIFEVSTFAGAHYALGAWYKPRELAKRASLVVALGNAGNLFSGVLQGGIQTTLDGHAGMPGWRWLFIVDAVITIPVIILGFATFPDTPHTTRAFYLNAEERELAISRLPPHKPTKLDWKVFSKVAKEWRYFYFVTYFALATNTEFVGLYTVMPLYMKAMKAVEGWTTQQINYYPCGVWAVIIASTAFFAVCTDIVGSRWWVNLVMPVAAGISAIILLVPDISLGARFFAYYLAGVGYIGQAVNFSWANEACRDDDQLRAFTVFTMTWSSNITITWWNLVLFKVTEAPDFHNGMIAVIVTCVCAPPAAYGLKYCLDKRAARIAAEGGIVEYDANTEVVDEKDASALERVMTGLKA